MKKGFTPYCFSFLNNFSSKKSDKGFTVIEILIVLAIIGIISTITLKSFSALNKSNALNTEADAIISMIERARARSVSSEDSSEYGVRFASSSVTIFTGTTYSSGASDNETKTLKNPVTISSINLTGGASDVYFNRLSGKPNITGNIALRLTTSTSTTKIITIYATGVSDVR